MAILVYTFIDFTHFDTDKQVNSISSLLSALSLVSIKAAKYVPIAHQRIFIPGTENAKLPPGLGVSPRRLPKGFSADH